MCVTVCVHVGTVVFVTHTMNYEVSGFQFICILGEHEQQVVEMRRLDWSEASCHITGHVQLTTLLQQVYTVTKRKLRTSWISIVLLSWSS